MTTIDPGVTGKQRPGGLRKTARHKARAPPPEEQETMSVPAAGKKYFGLSKNASYSAAARGEIPTIQIGRLLKVPIRKMEQILDEVGQS
jgi:hypothetical protein